MSLLTSIYRLDRMLSAMEEDSRNQIFEQLRNAEREAQTQALADKQLQQELINHAAGTKYDGVSESLLYQKLPPEVRHTIYTYCVTAEQSIHVFPPKGYDLHGYRLSLCEETTYDWSSGHCRCQNGRNFHPVVQSAFFDNAIFLVSRIVRREALDAFFMSNQFTFTCLHELIRFADNFKQSVAKIRRLRLLDRLDDYPASEYRIRNIQKTREKLRSLHHLDLHVYITTWSAYERLHEDGLLTELMHFALGTPRAADSSSRSQDTSSNESNIKAVKTNKSRMQTWVSAHDYLIRPTMTLSDPLENFLALAPRHTQDCAFGKGSSHLTQLAFGHVAPAPPPIPRPVIPALRSFSVTARTRMYLPSTEREQPSTRALIKRIEDKLSDVFMNTHRPVVDPITGATDPPKYQRIEDIESLQPGIVPKLKVREDERELESKRGILFMKD